MKPDNPAIMQMARASLLGKWGLAIGTFVVYLLIAQIPSSIQGIGAIVSLIIAGPFAIGRAIFSLSIIRKEESKLEQIFKGFNNFKIAFIAHILIVLNVIIRLLLLIVPGIIAGLSYSLTFYLLADNKSMSAKEAMTKSVELMDGNKLQLFYLGLRFFGLSILCILTLGIGFLWLVPYMNICMATFYEHVAFSKPLRQMLEKDN